MYPPDSLHVNFYLLGKFVGSSDFPITPSHRVYYSHHYLDVTTGRIWASVEIPGSAWMCRLQADELTLPRRKPEFPHPRGGLLLPILGHEFYHSPRNLSLLPLPILQLEFRAALEDAS